MRTRPVVMGNWKMNLDHVEAVHLTQQIGLMLRSEPATHVDVALAPPFTDLRSVSSVIEAERFNLTLCAQHVNPHDNGAYTGEVSAAMLVRLGVKGAIVGHSERRAMYAMDDDVVRQTLRACAKAGLAPVLCVGEGLDEREAGDSVAFVREQLRRDLEGIGPLEGLNVAYEPLWAIGTGLAASAEQVAEMMDEISRALEGLGYRDTSVLYGGSVTPQNAAELASAGRAQGFLVGGASLKAEGFCGIVRALDDCYAGKR